MSDKISGDEHWCFSCNDFVKRKEHLGRERFCVKSEQKFLPCPFCGGDVIDVLIQTYKNAGHGWLIKCDTCNASRFVVTNYKSQLYAEWNHRAVADGRR